MPQERLYRTEAIVLHELDYAETDRILTLLTPRGKLSALAKGIRRPTSRKVGHLGLFYRAQLMLARGHNLDIITQAESVQEYRGPARRSGAVYLCLLCRRAAGAFCRRGEENNQLYRAAVQGSWLSQEPDLDLLGAFLRAASARAGGLPAPALRLRQLPRSHPAGGQLFRRRARRHALPALWPGAAPSARAVFGQAAQKVLRYLQTHDRGASAPASVKPATHRELERSCCATWNTTWSENSSRWQFPASACASATCRRHAPEAPGNRKTQNEAVASFRGGGPSSSSYDQEDYDFQQAIMRLEQFWARPRLPALAALQRPGGRGDHEPGHRPCAFWAPSPGTWPTWSPRCAPMTAATVRTPTAGGSITSTR